MSGEVKTQLRGRAWGRMSGAQNSKDPGGDRRADSDLFFWEPAVRLSALPDPKPRSGEVLFWECVFRARGGTEVCFVMFGVKPEGGSVLVAFPVGIASSPWSRLRLGIRRA